MKKIENLEPIEDELSGHEPDGEPASGIPGPLVMDVQAAGGVSPVKELEDKVAKQLISRIDKFNRQQKKEKQQAKKVDIGGLGFIDSNELKWRSREAGLLDTGSLDNVVKMLTLAPEFKGGLVTDEFSGKLMIVRPMPWDNDASFEPRQITNDDQLKLRIELERPPYNLAPSKTMIIDAVKAAGFEQRINPVRDFLMNLKWDGIPRLDYYLIKYCGATSQPEEYVRTVSSCFIKASVKRVMEPGTPFHHMLVLEGSQRIGKSTTLKNLATFGGVSYFSDRIDFDAIGSKNIAEFLVGNLIVEFQELGGLNKKDRNKVKQWITQDRDEIQKKWENETTIYKRQFVVAGTTNDSHWLNDPTGGTRFWPVKCGNTINHKAILDENEQIWAEAVHRVLNLKELWYFEPNTEIYKIAVKEQEKRQQSDIWENIILEDIEFKNEITTEYLMKNVIGMSTDRWSKKDQLRVTEILTLAGFESKSVWTKDGQKRKWIRKEKIDDKETMEEIPLA